MKQVTKIFILALLFMGTAQVWAQDEITPERKEAIDSLAMEKVKDLSKYISIIGSKETTAWANQEAPIPMSYIDAVAKGYLDLYGRDGVLRFFLDGSAKQGGYPTN